MGVSPGISRLRIFEAPSLRAFRHRDFRLLWGGAFLSFVGSHVQNVAQGWLVWKMTGDTSKLAFVSFCGMAPVSLLGPFAGTLADTLNRRVVLVISQALFAVGALYLAAATYWHFVEYWQIVVVALILGLVSAVEMPTRQSLVSKVVPIEDLAAAVPVNAMTFNLARMLGPAIGGPLLASFGPETCYLVNGLSFAALIFAALAIRADLRAVPREPQPIADLLLGGVKYTFRDNRLRTLFLMESTVSVFALFYLSLMPAIAANMLHLDAKGYGHAMTSVGVGAMAGLLTLLFLADKPVKALLVKVSMTMMGLALVTLSFIREPWIAFFLMALAGMSGVVQFNTTNTLFQLLSPPNLRGRVLSMHIWALSGLAPFGILFFGWFARQVSIPSAILLGGSIVLAGALLGWLHRSRLTETEVGNYAE